MEPLSAALLTFGLAVLACSWVLLIIIAFKEDFTWGLSSVFVPPLAYFYALFQWSKAKAAVWIAILGWVLVYFALIE